MLPRRSGSIVNVSSAYGSVGAAGASVYVASKHAIEGLTKSAALEVAGTGVRVNVVAPGTTDTWVYAGQAIASLSISRIYAPHLQKRIAFDQFWAVTEGTRTRFDMTSELLERVLLAHGGLDRWNRFDTVRATIVTGGQLFGMKDTPQDSSPRRMTVATKREWASVTPYGANDQRTDFTAKRIAIEKMDGTVVKERLHPSEHAEGKAVDAPWDGLDRAYFNGYALWTYLTTAFHFELSYMQVIGMVTDHTVDCFRYREIAEESARAN